MTDQIFVLSGPIGAGKSTASKYFSDEYNMAHLSFVEKIWHPILAKRNIEITRHNLQQLGIELMDSMGATGLVDLLLEHVDAGKNYTIDDVRSPEVYDYLKSKLPQSRLIFLDVSIHDRLPRLKIRDGVQSIQEQQAAESVETETSISRLRDIADYVIENDGKLDNFHQRLSAVASENGLVRP